jgi:hypothetical protein
MLLLILLLVHLSPNTDKTLQEHNQNDLFSLKFVFPLMNLSKATHTHINYKTRYPLSELDIKPLTTYLSNQDNQRHTMLVSNTFYVANTSFSSFLTNYRQKPYNSIIKMTNLPLNFFFLSQSHLQATNIQIIKPKASSMKV